MRVCTWALSCQASRSQKRHFPRLDDHTIGFGCVFHTTIKLGPVLAEVQTFPPVSLGELIKGLIDMCDLVFCLREGIFPPSPHTHLSNVNY